jgi:hypothetical protein
MPAPCLPVGRLPAFVSACAAQLAPLWRGSVLTYKYLQVKSQVFKGSSAAATAIKKIQCRGMLRLSRTTLEKRRQNFAYSPKRGRIKLSTLSSCLAKSREAGEQIFQGEEIGLKSIGLMVKYARNK